MDLSTMHILLSIFEIFSNYLKIANNKCSSKIINYNKKLINLKIFKT